MKLLDNVTVIVNHYQLDSEEFEFLSDILRLFRLQRLRA